MNLDERLLRRVQVNGAGCWVWMGSRDPKGYGHVKVQGVAWMAHRLSYSLFVSDIPEGMQIDHLCRNTSCINPDHLESVTPRENVLRALKEIRERGTCVNGHEFTPENTRMRPVTGGRICRACDRAKAKKSYDRKKVGP